MVILGLLLVIAALVAGAMAVYAFPHGSADQVHVEHLGTSLSPTTIFLLGALSALALLLGLWLVGVGTRRRARRHRELRQLRKDQRVHERETLDARRDHDAGAGRADEGVASERAAHDPAAGGETVRDGGSGLRRETADERVVRDEDRGGSTGWRR